MKLSEGIRLSFTSSIVKLNWILVLATILFVYCSCVSSRPTEFDQTADHLILDNMYPAILISDDLVERAAPRLGRASPRLGRASPRLGRYIPTNSVSHILHAGRYYVGDEDSVNDYPVDFYPTASGKRAAPRLGRSI